MERTPRRYLPNPNNSQPQCPTPNSYQYPHQQQQTFNLHPNPNPNNTSFQYHSEQQPPEQLMSDNPMIQNSSNGMLPLVFDASTGMKSRNLSVNLHEPRTHHQHFQNSGVSNPPNPSGLGPMSSSGGNSNDRERLKDKMADSFLRNEPISILPGFKEDPSTNRKSSIKITQSNSHSHSHVHQDGFSFANKNQCQSQTSYFDDQESANSSNIQNQNQSRTQRNFQQHLHQQSHSQSELQQCSAINAYENPQQIQIQQMQVQNQNQRQQPCAQFYQSQNSNNGNQNGNLDRAGSSDDNSSSTSTAWPYGNQKSHRSIRQAQAAYKRDLDKQIEEKRQAQNRDRSIRNSISNTPKSNLQHQPPQNFQGPGGQQFSQDVNQTVPNQLHAFRNTGFLPAWFDPVRNNPLLYNNNNNNNGIAEVEVNPNPHQIPSAIQCNQYFVNSHANNMTEPHHPGPPPPFLNEAHYPPNSNPTKDLKNINQHIYSPRSLPPRILPCENIYNVPQEINSTNNNSNNCYQNQNLLQQQQQLQQQSNNNWCPPWLNLANLPPPPSPTQLNPAEIPANHESPNVNLNPISNLAQNQVHNTQILQESEQEQSIQESTPHHSSNFGGFNRNRNDYISEPGPELVPVPVILTNEISDDSAVAVCNDYSEKLNGDECNNFLENENIGGDGDCNNANMQILMLHPHVSQTASQRPDEEVLRIHYKSQLAKQIEEKKRLDEERSAKMQEDDAKFQRKIEEDQRRMVQEYEAEQLKHKQRQEEYRQRQEKIIKEKERFDREAEKLRLKKQQERRQRLSVARTDTPRRPSSKESMSTSFKRDSLQSPLTERNTLNNRPEESPIDLTICAASKWSTEARAKSPSNSKSDESEEQEETGSSNDSLVSSSSSEELPNVIIVHDADFSPQCVNNNDSNNNMKSDQPFPLPLSGRHFAQDLKKPARPGTVVISQHRSSSLNYCPRVEGNGGSSGGTTTKKISNSSGTPRHTSKSQPNAATPTRSTSNNQSSEVASFLVNFRKALLAEDSRIEKILKTKEQCPLATL